MLLSLEMSPSNRLIFFVWSTFFFTEFAVDSTLIKRLQFTIIFQMIMKIKLEPVHIFFFSVMSTKNRGISVFTRIHLFQSFEFFKSFSLREKEKKNVYTNSVWVIKIHNIFFSWSPFEKLCSSDLNSVKSEKGNIYFCENADMTSSWEF